MRDERDELIRAVQKRGEAVVTVATRLGVPVSTAYRWMRLAVAEANVPRSPRPTFIEVVAEHAEGGPLRVRVGVAEIEVRAGFDAQLLRAVVEALGADA
jgi:transposase-like protein